MLGGKTHPEDWFYDSPSPIPAMLFNERLMSARHEERYHEKHAFTYFLVLEGLSNDDVEGARDTVLQGIRPRVGFKTGDFVKEKLVGLP